MADRTYLVTGLGNIGAEYSATRHNIGFMVLDAWAQASNISFASRRYGDMAEDSVKGRRFILLKPSTYMNLSGNAVRYWMQEAGIPRENLIVICDDINLPFGTVRMRQRGSNGGHNGLRSIEESIDSTEYARIRIGVGHDFSEGGQVGFVLGDFNLLQAAAIPEICDRVISGVRTWALAGAQKAMTQLNTKAESIAN
ncbi:MAG: aminoacyl-tRNA hydrolase [Bacteroidales bacterium]|nr:aminoacyl-tRNA hydrolase [Bacteroidales bacterium]